MRQRPQVRTVGFKPGERNVFFHILTACNLRCRHCYINPTEHGTQTLSLDKVSNWLKLFARPKQETNLILLGGEPTLHVNLPAIIRTAKALRYAVTVDSNGYLLNDFLTRITPDLVDSLSFSLDGPDAVVNDPIRGLGSFQVCTDNIRRAVRAGFATSLIYTVSSLNINQLHKMPALLASLGIRRFFIQVIGLRGNPALESAQGREMWQVPAKKWLDLVPVVAENAASMGIHTIYPKVYLGVDDRFECAGMAAENYFIFPNGRVYQCPLCEDYPIHSYVIDNDKCITCGACWGSCPFGAINAIEEG